MSNVLDGIWTPAFYVFFGRSVSYSSGATLYAICARTPPKEETDSA